MRTAPFILVVSIRLDLVSFLCRYHVAQGGAIRMFKAKADIEDCTFMGNSATMGGAIFSSESHLTLKGTLFNANHAQDEGAGVYVSMGTADLQTTTFLKNVATKGKLLYQKDAVVTFHMCPVIPSPAKDQNKLCGGWADAGECIKNPQYMQKLCATSCHPLQKVLQTCCDIPPTYLDLTPYQSGCPKAKPATPPTTATSSTSPSAATTTRHSCRTW